MTAIRPKRRGADRERVASQRVSQRAGEAVVVVVSCRR
jgi:hypothetical protein